MFIANTASVGHRKKPVEFVGEYYTASLSTGPIPSFDPSAVIPGLEDGDILVVCSTVSNSGLSSGTTPNIPSNNSNGPTWTSLLTLYSPDTNDSVTRVSYAVHNGNSYTISLSSSYAVQMHQVLAFRYVSTITSLNTGYTSSTSYVNFPSISLGYSLYNDGVLQFGGGGQYRASALGTYPNPGVYDIFASHQTGTGYYNSGTVGFGFYAPESFTTNIPAVTWSGALYSHYRSSTFDITLRLQRA